MSHGRRVDTMIKKTSKQRGFTLIELSISVAVTAVLILAVGTMLLDNSQAYNKLYARLCSDAATDDYAARITFDMIMRKADGDQIQLVQGSDWVEVNYYQNVASTEFDRYARLYLDGGEMKLEEGDLETHTPLSTQTICSNVSYCTFTSNADVVEMVLKLDNGSETEVVVCSALRHN